MCPHTAFWKLSKKASFSWLPGKFRKWSECLLGNCSLRKHITIYGMWNIVLWNSCWKQHSQKPAIPLFSPKHKLSVYSLFWIWINKPRNVLKHSWTQWIFSQFLPFRWWGVSLCTFAKSIVKKKGKNCELLSMSIQTGFCKSI